MLPHQFRDNAPCQLKSSYGTRTTPLFPRQHNSPKRKGGNERVTGRKARGLQIEEIACKCQTFFSLLSGRRKQTASVRLFSFSIQNLKVSFKILCCHNDTRFRLKLAILESRDNQCLFLMEMFVLSYANVLCIYPRLCLQVGSISWLRTYLTNQYVILRYCFPNLCKQNYLYGNLPFYKIQVNGFTAWDESSVKIIPKCILWVRGLVPF